MFIFCQTIHMCFPWRSIQCYYLNTDTRLNLFMHTLIRIAQYFITNDIRARWKHTNSTPACVSVVVTILDCFLINRINDDVIKLYVVEKHSKSPFTIFDYFTLLVWRQQWYVWTKKNFRSLVILASFKIVILVVSKVLDKLNGQITR